MTTDFSTPHAPHLDLGTKGETAACRYLAKRGYTLLARNWRYDHLELDIVAEHYGELVIVEVKTRSSAEVELALSRIDAEKVENLRRAAGAFAKQVGWDGPIRLDAIVVIGDTAPFEVHHFKGETGML